MGVGDDKGHAPHFLQRPFQRVQQRLRRLPVLGPGPVGVLHFQGGVALCGPAPQTHLPLLARCLSLLRGVLAHQGRGPARLVRGQVELHRTVSGLLDLLLNQIRPQALRVLRARLGLLLLVHASSSLASLPD